MTTDIESNPSVLAKAIEKVLTDLLPSGGDTPPMFVPILREATSCKRKDQGQLIRELAASGAAVDSTDLLRFFPAIESKVLKGDTERPSSAELFGGIAEACELDATRRTQRRPSHRQSQWSYLTGEKATEDALATFASLQALRELRAYPDVIVFDDLPFVAKAPGAESGEAERIRLWNEQRERWLGELDGLRKLFTVHVAPLPVHRRHFRNPEALVKFVDYELKRLPRPTAAIVDLHWLAGDAEERDDGGSDGRQRHFGLCLIDILRRLKPTLPIFIWSNVADRKTLQSALQRGAVYFFDKPQELCYGHREPAPARSEDNYLDPGRLFFHVWEYEQQRYAPRPSRASDRGDFLIGNTPATRANLRRLRKSLELSAADLTQRPFHPVVEILRALVPDAEKLEVVQFLSSGQSGSLPPFLVRPTTSEGRMLGDRVKRLKLLQIKISKDWRGMARERKGYRDVARPLLGPGVSHVVAGPVRADQWCGMAQTFAGPEEAYDDPGKLETDTLENHLRKNLVDPEACDELATTLFTSVLRPLYQDLGPAEPYPCHKAFVEVTPPHVVAEFVPAPATATGTEIDFTPSSLSRKDERARREEAWRKWTEALEAGSERTIKGLVVDSLEPSGSDPMKTRLRLVDRTLGVKVDLSPGSLESAARWEALANGPLKLRGLPVQFVLDSGHQGLNGWHEKVVVDRLGATGVRPATCLLPVGLVKDPEESKKPEKAGETEKKEWRFLDWFLNWHPLDYSEEFHVGSVHGDLNPGNVLFHRKGETYVPWLIDFDKMQHGLPIVFDLVKLEVEVFHRIGEELFFDLCESCGLPVAEAPWAGLDLPRIVQELEAALNRGDAGDLDHLWGYVETTTQRRLPEPLRQRFAGFVAYLMAVRREVYRLGIGRREYLVGLVFYSLCSLKFSRLYQHSISPRAPFAAQLILYKLQCSILLLDRESGIVAPGSRDPRLARIGECIRDIRKSRLAGEAKGLLHVLCGPKLTKVRRLTEILRLLRDRSLPRDQPWFWELLWYVRDFGVGPRVERGSRTLCAFTKAIVDASSDDDAPDEPVDPQLTDFASTGRPGNTFPTHSMFQHLAEKPDRFVKISSRGQSGGTIDMLARAGIPICTSLNAMEAELDRTRWAVVEAGGGICDVDKEMMCLRKRTNCMKVEDLVMASITAKKLAVRIGSFAVEVSRGYDAKILRAKHGLPAVKKRWRSLGRSLGMKVTVGSRAFPTDSLYEKLPTTVIFGSTLLTALIWKELEPAKKETLKSILPAGFVEEAGKLAKLLEHLAEKKPKRRSKVLFDFSRFLEDEVTWPEKLSLKPGGDVADDLRGLWVVTFHYGKPGYRERVRVPFFDKIIGLLSQYGNRMASVLFFETRLYLLVPEEALSREEVELWSWGVLREGLDHRVSAEDEKGTDYLGPRDPLPPTTNFQVLDIVV